MFGLLLFGHAPFATAGVLITTQWIEVCQGSEWNNITPLSSSWGNEIKTTSNWDVKPPNVLTIKGCK